ncbi:MAG: MMPL family transporter, partial [Myxococcales bacterium]|nr:MMPL family transporter [Myxococcales bacterium]
MMQLPEAPTRRAMGFIHRHPALVLALIALSLAGVFGLVRYGPGIRITSRIQDLLPESAPSVQASELLEKRLGSVDMLVVTLMSDDLDRVRPVLPRIAARLEALEEVHSVQWRLDVDMLNRNALIIFPTLAELEDYYRELTDEIRAAVKRELKLFDDDEDEAGAGEDGAAKGAEPEEPDRTFVWGEWEHDDGLSNLGRTFREKAGEYREFFYNRDYTTLGLKVFPTQGSGNIDFCRRIMKVTEDEVRAVVEAELGPIGPEGVVTRIDLGGGYRNALEQVKSVQGDMVSSAGLSFGLLALVVMVFFRSVRAFFAVIFPLIVGIAWTVGFVSVTVGYLNLITAFIFAVLLGLGIDFGIHFYGRYREERAA